VPAKSLLTVPVTTIEELKSPSSSSVAVAVGLTNAALSV